MKSVILIALALVAVTLAAPVDEPKVVHTEFVQSPEGGYRYIFELDDGTRREEEGVLKEAQDEEGHPRNVVVVHGSFTYKNTEGVPESIKYVADETGFHAEGDSIPKSPEAY